MLKLLGIDVEFFVFFFVLQKSESDLVFDEDDRNLLISDPRGVRHKLSDPLEQHRKDGTNVKRRSRQSWFNWGADSDEEEEDAVKENVVDETESKGSNKSNNDNSNNNIVETTSKSTSAAAATTTATSATSSSSSSSYNNNNKPTTAARSTMAIEKRSVPTDDEDILREASGDELEGSGEVPGRGDVGPTTAATAPTTTTSTTTTTTTTTMAAPSPGSAFEKRE